MADLRDLHDAFARLETLIPDDATHPATTDGPGRLPQGGVGRRRHRPVVPILAGLAAAAVVVGATVLIQHATSPRPPESTGTGSSLSSGSAASRANRSTTPAPSSTPAPTISTRASTSNDTSPPSSPTPRSAVATTNGLPKVTYRTYRDPHTGFSVQVPARYRTKFPKTDGPEYLLSPDGRVRLTPTYEANFASDSPRHWLAIQVNAYDQAATSVTYTSLDGPVVIISGVDRGQVYYDRFVVYSHIIYELFWTYPPSLKQSLDPAVQHSVATFRPGVNRWS